MPNGQWAKGPGAIVARAILAGPTPPGFRDDVCRRMQFEDASSDPYGVVRRRRRGRTGRQSTNISMVLTPRGEVAGNSRVGTGVARPREGSRTVRVPLSGLLEKAARTVAQLTTRKTNALRVRRKRQRMIAGGWVVVVRQGVVCRVGLLGRI